MNSMESLVVVDQSFSAAKQMKKAPQNVNNNNNNNNSNNNNVNPHYVHQIARVKANNLSQNYATTPQVVMHDEYDKMMMMMMHGGLYLNNQHHALAPPYHHHHHHLTNSFPPTMTLGHGPHQPPLLPFPPAISRPPFHSQPPLRRSQSLSPPVIMSRKAPAKLNKTPPKKENKKGNDNGVNNSVGKFSKARKRTQVSIGPNPDLSRMMSDVEMDVDGCPIISPVFRMAPPPSSLPFPRFTLRKPPPPPPPMKLMRCKAEAAAVDGAATDNICILLKLR